MKTVALHFNNYIYNKSFVEILMNIKLNITFEKIFSDFVRHNKEAKPKTSNSISTNRIATFIVLDRNTSMVCRNVWIFKPLQTNLVQIMLMDPLSENLDKYEQKIDQGNLSDKLTNVIETEF